MTPQRRTLIIFLGLFVLAAAVRFVVWQNNQLATDEVQDLVTIMYQDDARILASGDIRTFLAGPDPPSNAVILTHPPGYPILMAPFYWLPDTLLLFRLFQIMICSLGAGIVFLIAREFFGDGVSITAGVLVAVSPQLSYYSGMLLPDGLCTIPIVLAMLFLVRSVRMPRLRYAILCGLFLGLSCLLRSNAMLLGVFAAAAAMILMPREFRVKFPAVLLLTLIATVAPVTIRNAIVFKSFIPLSLGMGHMIVIGLADYDTTGSLGLPKTDEDETALDARRDGRPDYYGSLYTPDGVLREKERTRLGVSLIAEHPVWFLSVIVRRGFGLLRMERVPVIARERDEKDITPPVLYLLNRPLKAIQSAFITAVILPLAILGLLLLLADREKRKVALLLTLVPMYYMAVQSLIYTEYRFVVAVPYFVFILAAVGIGFLAGKLAKLFGSNVDGTAAA
jgi:4-amino-4-deoxy-L-arabinose transferase-like glycosyltransferase